MGAPLSERMVSKAPPCREPAVAMAKIRVPTRIGSALHHGISTGGVRRFVAMSLQTIRRATSAAPT